MAVEHHQFADRDIQKSRNLDESRGGDPIGPVFVFLHLLKRNAEVFAQCGLRDIGALAIHFKAPTNRFINGLGIGLRHGTPSHIGGAQYTAPRTRYGVLHAFVYMTWHLLALI